MRAARVFAGLLIVAALLPATVAAQDDEPLAIVALSNRADLVSGDDVLLEVVVPARAQPGDVRLTAGDRDVTGGFEVGDDGRMVGLVEGLALGVNRVTATLPDGSGAYLDVRNHPIGGPVIAGPQTQPWVCATDAAGLGPPQDDQCNAGTVYEFRCRSAATQQFQACDPASPPPDTATTTTDQGETVPYVVRVERGTIDRGIYEIAVLWDESAEQPVWNGKAYWLFGGDCKPWHVQTGASALNDRALRRGFVVATSGLNTLGTDCNDVVSAEALMMVKERIVERYGEIRFTMSEGCSGGSMQQHWVAANYPGLLDGIQPSCSYPDIWETMQAAEDCHLMDRVFDQVSPQLWANPDDQAEAAGHLAATTCRSLWDNPTGEAQYARTWFDPAYAGGCGLPAAEVYDAEANPDGVRCTLQDYQVSLWGIRAEDGFANRPFDNVGVQYGLEALEVGDISPAQFVDLNVNAGGLDIDWEYQPERSVADPEALERAYLGGRITHGGELASVPIMDIRGTSNLEIHTDVHTYVTEARLIAANGHADNQVRWNTPCTLTPCPPIPEDSFVLLDAWLTAIEEDDRGIPLAQKVLDHRPEDAVDACFVGEQRITDQAQCDLLLPYYATPRLTAGAPMSDDVLKCQLRPLDRSSYPVEFSDAQWAQLEGAFAVGVCDWSVPGVGQQPPRGPWQSYAGGPDGVPLGEPPVSVPFGPGGPGPLVTRHAGAGRVETAVAVSGLGVDAADTVVLARADEYADALAGGPLAVSLDAPLLLTRPDGLVTAAAAEVARLGATSAVLLGGEAALGGAVAEDLEALGVSVRRVAGANRYATAAAIATELARVRAGSGPAGGRADSPRQRWNGSGELPDAGEALVARGDGFADALAASALGSALGVPILLVEPGRVPPETLAALDGGGHVTLVGGTAAVSEAVAEELGTVAGDVRRLAGATRYATSANVAEEARARGVDPDVTWVATGADFPDALVAGAAAGRDAGVLLLVDGADLDGSPETRGWLAAHAGQITVVRIAGGVAAVSPAVEEALTAVVRSGR